jgi:predicted N-formylglutamate amidohydrolase
MLEPDLSSEFSPAEGASPILITAPHASNSVPPWVGRNALGPIRRTHHALDRGAAALAHEVALLTGAAVLKGTFSRLVIDLNRSLDDEDLIPRSAGPFGRLSFNSQLRHGDLAARLEIYRRYHRGILKAIEGNDTEHPTLLVDLHTFTRVLEGSAPRQVDIGVCVAAPPQTALVLLDRLQELVNHASMLIQAPDGVRTPIVRRDQPYSGSHPGAFIGRAYSSLRARAVTIEVCDDVLIGNMGVKRVAQLLGRALGAVQLAIAATPEVMETPQ